jgi:hypothetical protein
MSLRNGRPEWQVNGMTRDQPDEVRKLLPDGSWGAYTVNRGEGYVYRVLMGGGVVAGPFEGPRALADAIGYADTLQ